MKHYVRYFLSRRMTLLLGLVISLSLVGLWTPNKVEAVGNIERWTTYYFDAAKTQYAGQCVNNVICSGESYCTGTTPTPYYTIQRLLC
jgi:hypothetical protein